MFRAASELVGWTEPTTNDEIQLVLKMRISYQRERELEIRVYANFANRSRPLLIEYGMQNENEWALKTFIWEVYSFEFFSQTRLAELVLAEIIGREGL